MKLVCMLVCLFVSDRRSCSLEKVKNGEGKGRISHHITSGN